MKREGGQNGAIMTEASLVFPLVLLTVVAILVLGMMKFQESMVQFGAQKIAAAAAREAVYKNYQEYIGKSEGMEIDLKEFPSETNVIEYYKNNDLYRLFGKDFASIEQSFTTQLTDFVNNYSFLTGMNVEADVSIASVLSPMVSVTVEYKIKLPGFLGLIGLPDSWKMETGAYAFAGDPTEFVRNIDIAVDLLDFLLDKLGLSDRVDIFLEKLDSIMKKIGG